MKTLAHLDEFLLKFINQIFVNPIFDWFFPAITDLHKTREFQFIALPFVLFFLFYRFGFRKGLIVFFMSVISIGLSDGLGTQVFKKTFERPRPHTIESLHVVVRSPSSGFAFVSNHSANMFNFAAYFSTFVPPLSLPLYVAASLVAYSRIYNGAHYPSDVLVGALLGVLIGFLMAKLTKWLLDLKFLKASRGKQ